MIEEDRGVIGRIGTAARRIPWIAALGIAWIAGGVGVAAAETDLARGGKIYGLCAQCHGEAGEGSRLALAPAIAGLPEWYVVPQLQHFKSGARGLHPGDVGGLRMHPMSLTLKQESDIRAVSAFVASLPAVPPPHTVGGGDAQQGATRYALCANCHGPDGAGKEQMKAPRLAGTSDWYLLGALQKYKDGVRGSNPGNPNGAIMRSFAAQLDDQAMLDLVAYINTLPGSK